MMQQSNLPGLALRRWQRFINFVFPGTCQLCSGKATGLLCEACCGEVQANYGHSRCSICALPLASIKTPLSSEPIKTMCRECMAHEPSFKLALCGTLFVPPVDQLVRQFKDHYGFQWTKVLCTPLLLQVEQRYSRDDDAFPSLLVPMPLHWRKHLRRGYNQSAIVASYLAKHLEIPVHRGLKKLKATPPQHNLKRKQRLRNLLGSLAFKGEIRGRHVALIDDVMTTGTSAECAAQILLQAGATRVDIWTLARTPKPEWR